MLIIVMSLSFLKAILKGLKHATSKGCNAWEVSEGKVTIPSPNAYVCSITSRMTWESMAIQDEYMFIY
jgi:hypothetical protein